MQIREIKATDTLPVKLFEVDNLSDVIVLAGRNGVGKTRLLQGIINSFQNPVGQQNMRLVIEATCDEERERWGKNTLDTQINADAMLLQQTLHENRLRRNWKSSVMNIESDRSIQQIKPYSFSFDVNDPDKESIGWNFLIGGLRSRHQDTIHSIFRKVHAYRNKISAKAEQLMRKGETSMDLQKFTDPLEPFKHAFSQLLAPKQLLDADLKAQQLKYLQDEQEFHINSLSSGEREVVNIIFDFILRKPNDCIVFFDEPELHLHPELSYKLIQTLTGLGENNQFIFCTHSPDIITASLEHSVVFVGAQTDLGTNQAIPVSEDDNTNHALKLLGQSVGIIALGKKILLVEGTHASLDKQTYGAIVKDRYPDLVLVPSGGKDLIKSFSVLKDEVLEKAIWGVEFYMLCDRDTVKPGVDNDSEGTSNDRRQVLNKYHLENYFLDENILASIFENVEDDNSWLRSPEEINNKLKEIATDMLSYTISLYVSSFFREKVGNIDIMPKDCHGKNSDEILSLITERANSEKVRISNTIDDEEIKKYVENITGKLEASLSNGNEWKNLIPGKSILNIFAGKAGMPVGRLKRAYINAAHKSETNPFEDILNIFDKFNEQ